MGRLSLNRSVLTSSIWTRDGVLWRRRRLVIAVWAVLVLASLPLAAHQADRLSGGGFTDPGAQSGVVAHELDSGQFPGVNAYSLAAVLVPQAGATRSDMIGALRQVHGELASVKGAYVTPQAARAALASARAHPARPVVVPLQFVGDEMRSIDLARDLRARLGISGAAPGEAARGRVQTHVAGQGALWAAFQKVADEQARQAESRGFPIIAVVLLVAFGSLAAALLPLTLGIASVILASAVIYLLSLGFDMSVFVTNVASMIGIGVAVDYSLFILVRYREEIHSGSEPADARARAMATSGRAVIFSGLVVLASLAGLFIIDSPGIRSMAVGAIVVVAISVLAAATLLPVVIGLLSRRAWETDRVGRMLQRLRPRRDRRRGEFWTRWTARVMRRPVVSVVGATALLLLLAAPALTLNVRNNATSQLDPHHEVRQGINAAAGVLGPGALGPVYAIARFAHGSASEPGNHSALNAVNEAAGHDPGVLVTAPVRLSADGRVALVTATLRSDPESSAARATLERLRRSLPSAAGGRAAIAVGGTTAALLDFDTLVTKSLWRLILFVLLLSYGVLFLVLRSVVLPLKAMLMNVLSVCAAYGVLVAVFQWGILDFVGVSKAPSMYPITLPLVLVVAFGLSMDYHIFLLTRIRERYATTGDNRRAVTEALITSATPITSAALIMVAVFLSFVSAGAPSVKQIGLAAAVAIAVDATLVRLVIVPAAMELLGKWNWWMPRRLAAILPATDRAQQGAAALPAPERGRDTHYEVHPAQPPQPRQDGVPAVDSAVAAVRAGAGEAGQTVAAATATNHDGRCAEAPTRTLVTRLDLPLFDYTSPDMRGERFRAAIRDLRENGWLAAGPYGCIVLERTAIEYFLRAKNAMTPGRPMIDLFEIDEGPLRELIERNILNIDGVDHRRLRGLVNPALSPRAVERYRPAMRRVLSELLDAVEPGAPVEFVSAVAKPYPAKVIATVLGAPVEDATKLQDWAHWVERQFDVVGVVEERDGIERAVRGLSAYASALIEQKRERGDQGDLISALVEAEDGGDRLSDVELLNLVIGLLAGGVDTAQSQLAHAIRLFGENPDQWRLLRERPSLVPNAVEAVLRHEPVLPFTARILLEDTVHRGVQFPAGTVLMLCISAATRDRGDGSDPDRFDITAKHDAADRINFGGGPHYCMGSNLARAELEEALAAMASRYARIELIAPPIYGGVTGVYGLRELRVRLQAARPGEARRSTNGAAQAQVPVEVES